MVAISTLTTFILAFTPLLAIAIPQRRSSAADCWEAVQLNYDFCLAAYSWDGYETLCVAQEAVGENACLVRLHPDDHN